MLDKLQEGGTSKQVAKDLAISPRTVDVHRQNILNKLEIDSIRALMLHRGSAEERRIGQTLRKSAILTWTGKCKIRCLVPDLYPVR